MYSTKCTVYEILLLVTAWLLVLACVGHWFTPAWSWLVGSLAAPETYRDGGWIYNYQQLIGAGLTFLAAWFGFYVPHRYAVKKRENLASNFYLLTAPMKGILQEGLRYISGDQGDNRDLLEDNVAIYLFVEHFLIEHQKYQALFNTFNVGLSEYSVSFFGSVMQLNLSLQTCERKLLELRDFLDNKIRVEHVTVFYGSIISSVRNSIRSIEVIELSLLKNTDRNTDGV